MFWSLAFVESTGRSIAVFDEPVVCRLPHDACGLSLAPSRCGMRLAAGLFDGHVVLWRSAAPSGPGGRADWACASKQCEMRGHGAAVNSVQWSADDSRLLSASDDRTLRVWCTTSAVLLAVLEGHGECVRAGIFGRAHDIVSISDDRTVRVWRARSSVPEPEPAPPRGEDDARTSLAAPYRCVSTCHVVDTPLSIALGDHGKVLMVGDRAGRTSHGMVGGNVMVLGVPDPSEM